MTSPVVGQDLTVRLDTNRIENWGLQLLKIDNTHSFVMQGYFYALRLDFSA